MTIKKMGTDSRLVYGYPNIKWKNMSVESREIIKALYLLGYKEESECTNILNKFISKVLMIVKLPKADEKFKLAYDNLDKLKTYAKEYKAKLKANGQSK